MNNIRQNNYPISIFGGKRDNIVDKTFSLSLSDLSELFNEHHITSTKDTIMYCMCSFATKWESYEPATKSIYLNGQVHKRVDILDENGCSQIGRLAANVRSINSIVLDYDGGETISQVRNRLSGYIHLGYTSYSHRKNNIDRFRVIVPLLDSVTPDFLRKRKKSILEFAGDCDPSTLSVGRAFYIPSCPAEMKNESLSWSCFDGELFDLSKLDVYESMDRVPDITNRSSSNSGMGPILYETMDIVQFVKDRNLYIRSNGNGKHEVICPLSHQHTNEDVTGTVVYEGGMGAWPVFYCSHTHGFSTKDFWRYFKQQEGERCFDDYCEREDVISIESHKAESDEKLISIFGRGFL